MDCWKCDAKDIGGAAIVKDKNTHKDVYECYVCYNKAVEEWQARMAIRMDASQFNPQKLLNLLFTDHWMHECKIIPDWKGKYAKPEDRSKCVVEYTYEDGTTTYLRHSNGPLQGYSWDAYGDDMHSPELAVLAISKASPPVRVHAVIPTHGN